MKKLVTYLAAGLLVVGAQSLMAQTATTSTNSVTAPDTQTPPKHREMTPEQRQERQAVLKLIGLTKDDLKGLTGKDLHAKIKEAADKFIDDMKAKKASGTLTDEEQANLEKVQKFMAHGGKHKAAAPAAAAAPANSQ